MRFFYLYCSNMYKYDLIIMKKRYLCQKTVTEILQYMKKLFTSVAKCGIIITVKKGNTKDQEKYWLGVDNES